MTPKAPNLSARRSSKKGREKGMKTSDKPDTTDMTNPPLVPLKNIQEWPTGDPNGLRETPLVPGGTVADTYTVYVHI